MKGPRNWTLLLVVLVASLVILTVGRTGSLQPVENGASTVLVPVQYTVQEMVRWLLGVARIPHDLQHLRSENQRLQAQVDELIYQLILQREIEIENAQLRELLQLKDQSPQVFGPQADLLTAAVIARDPSNLLRYLTIDRGSDDGLKAGMPVITARGLVGQVSRVRPNSSKVVLLTDPASKVNALVQRSRATGVVEGQTGPNLKMRYLPQMEGVIEDGDLVLTSGLGGGFPRRLLIGRVIDVQHRDIDMFQEATLQPAVDYDRLETVVVVRHFTPIAVDAPPDRATEPAGGTQ